MSIADLLRQYAGGQANVAPDQAEQHFDQVAGQVPREALGDSVAQALRSDQTPELPAIIGDLFGKANPEQRAGMLNQVLSALGPAVLSGAAGGILGQVLGGARERAAPAGPLPGAAQTPQVTPEQARTITPEQVQSITAQAEAHHPGIVDKLGQFYAQHPDLVKKLGAAALTVVLANLASRNRNS